MSQTLGGDENYQFKWSMLAMVGFGLGEIFGGFFIGFIVDRWGTKTAIICNLIIILLMNAVTLVFIYQFEFNALPWIMCFLWGFQDSGVNTQIQETLGFEFDNASSEPFSIYNIYQCIACFIFQIIEASVGDQNSYWWFTIGVGVIAFLSNGLPYFFPFREDLANKIDIIASFTSLGSKNKKREQDHMMVQPYTHQKPLMHGDYSQDHHKVRNLSENQPIGGLLINTMNESEMRADSSNKIDVNNLFTKF